MSLTRLVGTLTTLMSGLAHAVIDLDATGAEPVGTVTVSNETLSTAADRVVSGSDGQTYNVITLSATSTVLRVDGKMGLPGRSGRQLFVRYDLANMVFRRPTSQTGAPPSTGTVRINDADNDGTTDTGAGIVTLTREAGGDTGDSYVVYAATDGATIDAEAVISAYLHNELAIRPNLPGRISQSTYLGLMDALDGQSPLVSKSQTAVTTASSVSASVTPAAQPLTASVTSGFTQLEALSDSVGANSPQPLGSVTMRVRPAMGLHLVASDGRTVLVPADVMVPTQSRTMFSGDFSAGSFALSTDGCATTEADSLSVNTAKDEATATILVLADTYSLCMTVPRSNEEQIRAGEFFVEADYAPLANAAIEPTDLAETLIGRIRRNGATVQIPNLTTASEYEQHIVIVNRSSRVAAYNFQFTPASDVTAHDGVSAEGTVGAFSTLVLQAADVVTLSGGTDTAASLNVVAPFGRIDVLTTQVNFTSGDTDTVRYQVTVN